MDPNIGTVLGRNVFTNRLYATTNNGAGCVETEDDMTWISTSCRFVEQLEGRWWYKKAQSLDVDEDRPYAVRGSGRTDTAPRLNCLIFSRFLLSHIFFENNKHKLIYHICLKKLSHY